MNNLPSKNRRIAALEKARQGFLAQYFTATEQREKARIGIQQIDGQLAVMAGLEDSPAEDPNVPE